MQPTAEDAALYELAREASTRAHAPYSKFPVGAALRTTAGDVITGANIENASFGLTCCAERTAIFTAVAAGQAEFASIAVYADAAAASPCGACRQVMAEFAPDLRVIWRRDGELVVTPLPELLADGFRL
jgi:homotetrameric cytidine deaminase